MKRKELKDHVENLRKERGLISKRWLTRLDKEIIRLAIMIQTLDNFFGDNWDIEINNV